jgi:hypothetical protein
MFSTIKEKIVEQDMAFCASLGIVVHHFEVNRLDQGIRLSILRQDENLHDLRCDRIAWSRSFPAPSPRVSQQSSETNVQLYENREVLLPSDAAGHGPDSE